MTKLANRNMKILIVEPDEVCRKRLSAIFRNSNRKYPQDLKIGGTSQVIYTVYEVEKNEDAFAYFMNMHPDIMLIGFQGGVENISEEISKIRDVNYERHTGIIVTSFCQKNDTMASVECLESGADDFLTFEISDREILARVNAEITLAEFPLVEIPMRRSPSLAKASTCRSKTRS